MQMDDGGLKKVVFIPFQAILIFPHPTFRAFNSAKDVYMYLSKYLFKKNLKISCYTNSF